MFDVLNLPYFLAPSSFLDGDNNYLQAEISGLGNCNLVSDKGNPIALSNSCAHRGMEIISERIGTEKLQCSYHGWRYSRSGRLKPNRIVGKNTCIKLPSKKLENYKGFVGISLSEAIPEIDEILEFVDVELSLKPFHYECLVHNANWKWLVENVLEAYHLDFVHRKSFVEQGFILSDDIQNFKFGKSSANYVPKKKFGRGFYKHGYIFPNLLVSNTSDFVTFCSLIIPLGEEKSCLYWFLFPGKKMTLLPDDVVLDLQRQSIKFTQTALIEDKEMVEAQQRGTGSQRSIHNITDIEPRVKWFWNCLQDLALV